MTIDVNSVRPGMPVFGADGNRIGTVLEVRPNAPAWTDDAGLGSAAPDPNATAGARITALGGLGGKGRGSSTDTDISAGRGDVHAVPGAGQGTDPGAGGQDILRGYGPTRSGAADAGINVSDVDRTGNLGAPGSIGGMSDIDSSAERDRGVTDADAVGYLMISADDQVEVSLGGLHVPLSAVRDVETGTGVTLTCPKSECINLYSGGRPLRPSEAESGLI